MFEPFIYNKRGEFISLVGIENLVHQLKGFGEGYEPIGHGHIVATPWALFQLLEKEVAQRMIVAIDPWCR